MINKKNDVVFILDFGNKFGFGHLSRCSNLAKHLKEKGIKTFLITTKKYRNKKIPKLEKKFLEIFENNIYFVESLISKNLFKKNNILNKINEIVANKIVILDHYYLDLSIVKSCSIASAIFQFKDDFSDYNYVDLNCPKNKIIYFLPNDCIPSYEYCSDNVFAGLDLCPLFPPKINIKRPIEFKEKNLNILITPGANGSQFAEKLIEKILIFKNKINIKIFSSKYPKIMSNNLNLIDGSDGLEKYILFSDLVVTAGGNTMLESIFLGTPTIAFSTNKNQINLLNFLNNKNDILYIKNLQNLEYVFFNFYLKKKIFLRKNQYFKKFSYERMINLITKI